MFYLCIRLITKHMDEITKIETVDQYDQLFGLETLHPLVKCNRLLKSYQVG